MLKLTKNIFFLQYDNHHANRLKISLKLFLIGLVSHLVCVSVLVLFKEAGMNIHLDHPTTAFLRNSSNTWDLLILFFLSVLLHPLIEELSFRQWVTTKTKPFSFGLAFCFSFISLILLEKERLIPISSEITFNILFFSTGLTLGIFIATNLNPKISDNTLPLIVVLSSVLFASVHLNVLPQQSGFVQYLVLLSPYFLKGIILSYGRITAGLGCAFFVHFLHNGLIYTINVFF